MRPLMHMHIPVMIRTSVRRILYGGLLLLLWVSVMAGNAIAHGGGGTKQLTAVPMGANTLDVWTSPALARAGEIHVEVLVTNAANESVDRQRVIVSITPRQSSGEPTDDPMRVLAATNDAITGVERSTFWQRWQPASRQEAAFTISEPGLYDVEITVLDVGGQGGRATFELSVLHANGWGIVLLQGLIPLLALGGSWLFVQGIARYWTKSK